MTLIYASIALAFALYFTACLVIKSMDALIGSTRKYTFTKDSVIACVLWGIFHYCTHI